MSKQKAGYKKNGKFYVYCKDHYAVGVRECYDEDIVEIDTFNELKQIDKTYDSRLNDR